MHAVGPCEASPGLLAGCCGPTRVSWQWPSIRIAGQYYVGPRGSSAWQPAMLLMGQCKKNVLNIAAYNWPMREHVQHFVMGLYEYMHLLQRLGPRCFFRGIQLYCTWVLPTTMTMYATWAHERALVKSDRTQGAPTRRSTQWEGPVRTWKNAAACRELTSGDRRWCRGRICQDMERNRPCKGHSHAHRDGFVGAPDPSQARYSGVCE